MGCTPAPACKALLAEATHLWPNRSRASDGICASPKHSQQNPTSDHETGDAADLTDDKAGGCDADAFAEALRVGRDPRVKYVICNRRMFSSYATGKRKAWEWGPYTGANPHEKHTHVSILPGARNNTSPWFGVHAPASVLHSTIRAGSSGAAVSMWQQLLNDVASQHLTVSGRFDPYTVEATKDFQRFFHLDADGVVGPKTWAAMDYAAARR